MMTPDVILKQLDELVEYSLIRTVYEGKVSRRSGLHYVNHIVEGVYIIARRYGWLEDTISAFCVHPIFQSDKLLARVESGDIDISPLSSKTIDLAVEYRRIANSYLSTGTVRSPDEIELASTASVNQMLVADKIQNKKDFMGKIYRSKNSASFRRVSDHYVRYFDSWLTALGVTPAEYETLAEELNRVFEPVG